jgi:hypothetical protein
MTDETKKLFDAPWKAVEIVDTNFPYLHECEIVSNNGKGHMIATEVFRTDANRLARLPEMCDALVETVYYKCFECMGGLRHNIDMTREELVKNGCPKQNKSNVCIYVKHIELLRKVRDGE